jgi:tellurite resistance protein
VTIRDVPESNVIVQLPADALSRLPAAIAALIPTETERFLAVLELGYLAASADGLDSAERDSIAATLERVTGIGYDHSAFAAHFQDLDASVAVLGRRERLARTAAEFESDDQRANAIRFAALVAMADGALHVTELAVLDELGSHYKWTAERVRELVTEAAARVGGGR